MSKNRLLGQTPCILNNKVLHSFKCVTALSSRGGYVPPYMSGGIVPLCPPTLYALVETVGRNQCLGSILF